MQTFSLQFIVHFHQAVLDNNLPEITVAYESGWNRLTEKFYAKTEWPEAEAIAPLVNDGVYLAFFPRIGAHIETPVHPPMRTSKPDQIFLILYRELYYRHVYSRLQPDIDDRFHSYENSCELFNYLLSKHIPRVFVSRGQLNHNLTHHCRLGRPCPSRASRTMAMGHHRRIHLPIPILLCLAIQSQIKDR